MLLPVAYLKNLSSDVLTSLPPTSVAQSCTLFPPFAACSNEKLLSPCLSALGFSPSGKTDNWDVGVGVTGLSCAPQAIQRPPLSDDIQTCPQTLPNVRREEGLGGS